MEFDSKIVERFWKKVQKGPECWEWIAGRNQFGRGFFSYAGKNRLAYRFSWMLANKQEIPEGLFICHKCDNPGCVRPDHLFMGTRSDNMLDCSRKGRIWQKRYPERLPRGDSHYTRLYPEKRNIGEKSGQSKLKDKEVRLIRSNKEPAGSLAKRLGVDTSTIYMVRNYKTWKHLK